MSFATAHRLHLACQAKLKTREAEEVGAWLPVLSLAGMACIAMNAEEEVVRVLVRQVCRRLGCRLAHQRRPPPAQNLDNRLTNMIIFGTMGILSAIQPISPAGRACLLCFHLVTGVIATAHLSCATRCDQSTFWAIISITVVPFVVGWAVPPAVEAPADINEISPRSRARSRRDVARSV